VVVETESVKKPEPLSDEIRYVHFRYWDGTKWLESWDGIKLPLGVEISLGFEPPSVDEQGVLEGEVFRRVVYLPGANANHPEFTPVSLAGGTL